jgi:hypothetical protein
MKMNNESKFLPSTAAYLALASGDGAALLAGGDLRIDLASGRSIIVTPQSLPSVQMPEFLRREFAAWVRERRKAAGD